MQLRCEALPSEALNLQYASKLLGLWTLRKSSNTSQRKPQVETTHESETESKASTCPVDARAALADACLGQLSRQTSKRQVVSLCRTM